MCGIMYTLTDDVTLRSDVINTCVHRTSCDVSSGNNVSRFEHSDVDATELWMETHRDQNFTFRRTSARLKTHYEHRFKKLATVSHFNAFLACLLMFFQSFPHGHLGCFSILLVFILFQHDIKRKRHVTNVCVLPVFCDVTHCQLESPLNQTLSCNLHMDGG